MKELLKILLLSIIMLGILLGIIVLLGAIINIMPKNPIVLAIIFTIILVKFLKNI